MTCFLSKEIYNFLAIFDCASLYLSKNQNMTSKYLLSNKLTKSFICSKELSWKERDRNKGRGGQSKIGYEEKNLIGSNTRKKE